MAAPASIRRRHHLRTVRVSLALALVASVLVVVSTLVGELDLSFLETVGALAGSGDGEGVLVVRTFRLPRAVAAIVVGAGFGLSGAIFQSIARNPLASPDIIGVTGGAAAGAVAAIVAGVKAGVPIAALVGAFGAAALIYVLAYRRGSSGYRLILVGIGVGAVLSATTSYLLTRAEIYDAQRALHWLAGSLSGASWGDVWLPSTVLAVVAPFLVTATRQLGGLQLGDHAAEGIGLRVERSRAVLVAIGVTLAAVSTASAGPVAFVAFVAPAIARRLDRSTLALVPSMLAGAGLVLSADLLGRIPSADLPVGIVTGLVGAPYLLYLLARTNLRSVVG